MLKYWFSEDETVALVHTDALHLLNEVCEPETVALVVTDPPWNTGQIRKGANGTTYSDRFDAEQYENLLDELFRAVARVLTDHGTFALWLDWRWVHCAAVVGDSVFEGRRVGEIICHAELGNPGKKAWPVKHSTILLYAKDAKRQYFDYSGLPLTKRKAPKKGHGEKYTTDERRVNSVLETTMSNTDAERVGYPDQKPSWVYRALVDCYTRPGDLVVDPFAGSGPLGRAVVGSGRLAVLGDQNLQACEGAAKLLNLVEAR